MRSIKHLGGGGGGGGIQFFFKKDLHFLLSCILTILLNIHVCVSATRLCVSVFYISVSLSTYISVYPEVTLCG